MSYLKITTNLFLEKQELNKFLKFIDEEGLKTLIQKESISFGLIKNQSDNTFENGYISTSGASAVIPSFGYVRMKELFAIDSDALFIKYPDSVEDIAIPNDGDWYWIKVAHNYNPTEEGVVTIATTGSLTGINTKFTEVLRGRPNFPSVIKFVDSSSNLSEYEVTEVISDTSAIITGPNLFTNESNIKYKVVGTFTPGISVSSGDKYPLQYDSATISVEAETLSNTKPSYTVGKEFFLARVRVTGGTTLEIQDKRDEIFLTKEDFLLKNIPTVGSVVAGIESIRFNNLNSSRKENIIHFEWGFKGSAYTIDTNLRKVSITAGSGGLFKSSSDFANGNFDGYRLYSANGKYSKITSSTKSGSNINLILDYLNPDDFTATEVFITPDAEGIEVSVYSNDNQVGSRTYSYPIFLGLDSTAFAVNEFAAKIKVDKYGTTSAYKLLYRFKSFNSYSPFFSLAADAVGYYAEDQFDITGNLLGSPSRTTYNPGSTNFYLLLQYPTDPFGTVGFASAITVNAGSIYNPSYVLMPTFQFVTPNDGRTRKYSIKFKANWKDSGSSVTEVIDVRIYNATDAATLDEINIQHNKNTAADYVSTSFNLTSQSSIGPNKTIQVQAQHSQGEIVLTFSKLEWIILD